MKILAIDIGAGTQDILLYDSNKQLENCVKLVLPSPSSLLAAEVARIAERGKDIFIDGYTIGGGALSHEIKRHMASGRRIIMTPSAAYTIRNNLDDVAAKGIEIRDDPPRDLEMATVNLDELNLSPLRDLLASVGENSDEIRAVGVAVQDHGAYRSGESNRKTRLSQMRSRLEENSNPLSLSYLSAEVPDAFPRMVSAAKRLGEQLPSKQILIMDTAPAAVAGCLTDKHVSEMADGNLLLINAGNGHTLACILRRGGIIALLEHHTRQLEAGSFARYLEAFCAGDAKDDDAYMASGHGLFYLEEPPGTGNLDLIAITGPNRDLLEGTALDFYYPSPGGDMMMTGPMGLVEAVKHKLGNGDSDQG